MTAIEAFAAQVRASRLRTFDTDDGQRITYMVPSQSRAQKLVAAMREHDGDAVVELLLPQITAWSLTQAVVLGAGVGNDDPAPVVPDAVRAVFGDRGAWVWGLAVHAVNEANEAFKRTQAAAGN